MQKYWQKWMDSSLILRILIFLAIGAVLGLTISPDCAVGPVVALLGTIFVGALKAVAPILVFFLVMSALANAKSAGNMKTVVVLYLISTFVAALVAVLASYAFPTSLTLVVAEGIEQTPASGIGEVLTTLLTNMVANPVAAIANANYIGILTWSVLIGVALRVAPAGTRETIKSVADAIIKVVLWVINLALVTNPIIVAVTAHINPYPLVLRALRDSAVTAFFTRSSAANIPVNMELCRKLKLDENNYSVSIPLGATINMAGAAVTITVMAMAAHYTMTGTFPDIPTAVLLSAIAAIGAAGASGVPGGSLLLIPLACSLFGIDNDIAMQVVAVGFIIGVVQDSCETALNSSSDVVLTATAEYREWKKEGRTVDFAAWEK